MKEPQKQIKREIFSPRFFRFITESPFFGRKSFIFRISVISLFSLFLFVGIVQQAQLFVKNQKTVALQSLEKQKVQEEIRWWEHVSKQYQGYRDVYWQIATLQYRLGNTKGANESIGKVLQLDPNFQEALVLREKLAL